MRKQENHMEKKEIRRLVAARKKEYSEAWLEEKSARITAGIRRLPAYREAGTVFAYMDLPGEVRMRDFIRGCLEDGKAVAVPKIFVSEEPYMSFFRIDSFDVLREGRMHIMEPDPQQCDCMDADETALIIMPGVAFDTELRRIGYGGGFYDRYLAAHPDHPTIAAAFSFQVFDRIPSEAKDIRPQTLVTEERILQVPGADRT